MAWTGASTIGNRLARVAALSVAALASGCASFAPQRLYQDQIGYAESLGDSQKAQTLLNVVRLRYGGFRCS